MTETILDAIYRILDELDEEKKRHQEEMRELGSKTFNMINNFRNQIEKEGTTRDMVVDYGVMKYQEKRLDTFSLIVTGKIEELCASLLEVFENIKETKKFEKKLKENNGNYILEISLGRIISPPSRSKEDWLFTKNSDETYDVYALGKIVETDLSPLVRQSDDKYKKLYISTGGKFVQLGDKIRYVASMWVKKPVTVYENMIYDSNNHYEFFKEKYEGKHKKAVDKMMSFL